MKTIILTFILFLFSNTYIVSQETYIPDDNFEQTLINLGYDSVLDDYVLTANINTVNSLDVTNSNIEDLTGIEDFVALNFLGCSDNTNLNSLDVSTNTALTILFINNTNISSIDLSTNTALTWLDCNTTNLSNLDLSNNTNLDRLYCQNTNLISLDLSDNINLTEFYCINSPNLISLNIKNGNNNNTTLFNATNNINLTCIEVDDEAYSNANWPDKDSTAFYSIDCTNLSTIEKESYSFHIYPNPTKTKFTIKLEDSTELKNVTIYNNLGQQVLTSKNYVVDTSKLASGLYLVEIETNKGKGSKKLIIE